MLLTCLAAVTLSAGPQYQFEILSTPEPGQAQSVGITAGIVVGESRPLPGFLEPCIWIEGQRFELGIPPGASQGIAEAVNRRGVVVGYGDAGLGTGVAFKYFKGQLTLLPAFAGDATWAVDVNDRGQVVGGTSVAVGEGVTMAALWQPDGQPQLLGNLAHLGGLTSLARALNDRGEVVGEVKTDQNAFLPFYYRDGVQRQLPLLPGDTFGVARDINEHGVAVGTSGTRAVTWKRGAVEELPAPAGEPSWVGAINNHGQAVGSIGSAPELVLWSSGEPHRFSELAATPADWTYFTVHDLDDEGRIVGTGFDGGELRGFLLTPLAEDEEALGADRARAGR